MFSKLWKDQNKADGIGDLVRRDHHGRDGKPSLDVRARADADEDHVSVNVRDWGVELHSLHQGRADGHHCPAKHIPGHVVAESGHQGAVEH